MAGVGTIESRLIISAADETGVVIDALAAKIEALDKKIGMFEKASAAAGKVSGSHFDAAAKGVERLGRAVDGIGGKVRGIERLTAALGKVGDAAAAAVRHVGAIESLAGGVTGGALAGKGVHAASDLGNVINQARMSGMTDAELREAQAISASLSMKYPSITQAQILDQLRSQRAVTGSFEHAKHVIEDSVRLRAIAQMKHPGEDVSEHFEYLNKGMEILGQTMDDKKHHSAMDYIAKATNFFGKTLTLEDYYQMASKARGALTRATPEFMFGVMPTISSELRGQSAGTAVASFNRAIVGGRMSHGALESLNELGILDPNKIMKTETGSIKGIKPGGILGWELAQENPYEWVRKILSTAMEKKDWSEARKSAFLSAAFSDRTTKQLVDIFLNQGSRIDKDLAGISNAEGLEAADKNKERDPGTALAGFSGAFTNLLATFTGPVLEGAIPAINGLSSSLNKLSDWAAANPQLAAAAGISATAGAAAAGAATTGAALRYGARLLGFGGTATAGEAAAVGSIGSASSSFLPTLARFAGGPIGLALGSTLGIAANYGHRGKYEPGQIATPRNMLQGMPNVDLDEVSKNLGRDRNGEPLKAELTGSAEIRSTVEVQFNESMFLAKVRTMVDGAIKGIRINASGIGSSGKTLPDPAAP